jgi:hypothetical protein
MSDIPVHQQRMRALLIAAQKRQQFDTLAEMRHIKMMVILSFLLEFECATAATLLDLLEIKSNAILTRMVKQRFIKLFRWQNSQVYVPTQLGKQWLLEHLDVDEEIERVQNYKIRRKIGGYSAEHDLLVQRAAICYARENAKPGEQWRIFKPRKTGPGGIVPDARIVYTRSEQSRQVFVEVERTPKPPVETICKFFAAARNMGTGDEAVFLCTSQKIARDYYAGLISIRHLDMWPVECVQIDGVARHALQRGSPFGWGEAERLDVAMIDDTGQVIDDALDPIEAAFASPFWLLALQQSNQDWRHWAHRLAAWVVEVGTMPTWWPDDDALQAQMAQWKMTALDTPLERGPNDDDVAQAKAQQADLLIGWLSGPDEQDNPMRSASDLRRAEARYRAWLAGLRRNAMFDDA